MSVSSDFLFFDAAHCAGMMAADAV